MTIFWGVARENVERLRSVYAEWARGNLATPEVLAPDLQTVWSDELPAPGTYHGVEGLVRSLRPWFEVLEDCRFEAEEFIHRGDRVLVFVVVRARGRGSSVEVEGRYAHLWTMRDGEATRLQGFVDRDAAWRALESAG